MAYALRQRINGKQQSYGPSAIGKFSGTSTRAGRDVHAVSAHKKPLTPHGFHDATTDEATIRGWWRRSPDALVATPTGPGAGIWVLDVDGMAGRDSLNGILATLGLERPQDLTPIIVRTPSGGLHLYFRCGPGEEVRTRAGDIASRHRYPWDWRIHHPPRQQASRRTCLSASSIGGCGRQISLIDLASAPFAPRDLVYDVTFNTRERAEIEADWKLRRGCKRLPLRSGPEFYGRTARRRRSAFHR